MFQLLPRPLIILTAISLILSLTVISLTLLNLRLAWANVTAGALTVTYHLLVFFLAWLHRGETNAVLTFTNVPTSEKTLSKNHPVNRTTVPYPTTYIALSTFVLIAWVIALGTTVDVAIKGPGSTLHSVVAITDGMVRAALSACSVVIGVEIIVVLWFIWYCMKSRRRAHAAEKDTLEEEFFSPSPPTSAASLKRFYSKRSIRASKANVPKTPVAPFDPVESKVPLKPFLLKAPELVGLEAPEPVGLKLKISPWEMLTPAILTPSPPPSAFTPTEEKLVQNSLVPLRRPPSSVAPPAYRH